MGEVVCEGCDALGKDARCVFRAPHGSPVFFWGTGIGSAKCDLADDIHFVGFGINMMIDSLRLAQEEMPEARLGLPRFSFHMTPPNPNLPGDMRGLMVALHLDVPSEVAIQVQRLSSPA